MEKTPVSVVIRPLREEERPQVRDFLHLAIFVPEGAVPPDVSVLDEPVLRIYYEDFGRPDDVALVAERKGQIVGMAWSRMFSDEPSGFGTLDRDTPECSVSVRSEFRGRGIGTDLMKGLLSELRRREIPRVSLSVQLENPAIFLYRGLGFVTVAQRNGDVLMVCDLSGQGRQTANGKPGKPK